MSYKIKDYTKKQALKMGLEVKVSKHKGKKIDVYKQGKFIHSIGALGYMDYPHYLEKEGLEVAEKHRKAYHKRHTKNTIGEKLALKLLW
jgi:hypothetical protein